MIAPHGNKKSIEHVAVNANCYICVSHKPGKDGYTQVKRNGKYQRLHRYLWQKEHGAIPFGQYICHKCNNNWCINIAHMYVGDQKTNMLDKARAGTTHTRILTREVVEAIRIWRPRWTGTNVQLGELFGVNERTIRHVVDPNSHAWRWVN